MKKFVFCVLMMIMSPLIWWIIYHIVDNLTDSKGSWGLGTACILSLIATEVSFIIFIVQLIENNEEVEDYFNKS